MIASALFFLVAMLIAFFLFPYLWKPSIQLQPCVTDDEFCELIPDVSRDVASTVRGVMADASGWDREEIHPETRLVEF